MAEYRLLITRGILAGPIDSILYGVQITATSSMVASILDSMLEKCGPAVGHMTEHM
jgi:hypothetical protein